MTTYLTLKKRFDKRLEKETEEAREWLNKKKKTGAVKSALESTAEQAEKATDAFSRFKEAAAELKETIAASSPDDCEPFIYQITPDEFGENGFTETQLFYYAADETLADAEDNEIEPDETNVGDELSTFIYTDAENVYVRNTETRTDYEVVRVEGSFASMESEGLYD